MSVEPIPPSAALNALIQKCCPGWWLASKEAYYPIDVSEYLKQCDLVDEKSKAVMVSYPLTSEQISKLPQGFFEVPYAYNLAISNGVRNPVIHGNRNVNQVTMPVHCIQTDSKIYVQYIAFYAYNGASPVANGLLYMGAHEADVESVIAVIDRKSQELLGYYLSQHGNKKFFYKEQMEQQGGRYLVYSAINSHAHYPHPGAYSRFYGCVHDECSKGVWWAPTKFLPLYDQGTPYYQADTMGFLRLNGDLGGAWAGGHVANLPLKPWWNSALVAQEVTLEEEDTLPEVTIEPVHSTLVDAEDEVFSFVHINVE